MNERVRADFPILKHIIYMDSAATSLTPEPVVEAVAGYYRDYNANVGRGVYRLSQVASQKYKDAHEKVAGFIGAKEAGEVIFTKNTTEAINMVAYGLKWASGDEVVTTLLEHHSNFLPWFKLREKGVNLKIVNPNRSGEFKIADFEAAIGDSTRLVAITHVSNVLGTISPIKELSAICKEKGALLLVDGAQSAPHIPLDVEKLGCDFLAFSGHKMLGPTGTGVLWVKDPDGLEPTFFGGGMIEKVSVDGYELAAGYERFEAGTPNIAGGIGLGRAVDYLNDVGMDKLQAYEERLAKRLLEGLLNIEAVQVYGSTNPSGRIGVVSFNIGGSNPHDVALMLDEASGITVRSGHHCCMPLMNYLHVEGTVRVSLYLYNTEEEVDKFLKSVESIARVV
ncbi:MAG: aminotransferase class V [Desulfuromonadales bacterium C00003107]|nr:MAG: aminotransferase class V [Desulfuromonadales bacterium C00003107]